MAVLVARFAGASEPDKVNRCVYQAFLLSVFLAIGVMAPLGYFLAPHLLDAVNPSPEVRAEALPYLRIMFVFSIGLLMFFMCGGALRAAGDARTPLYLGIALTVLNIILNAILIPGLGPIPAFGTRGAAMATVMADGIVSVVFVWLFFSRRLVIQFSNSMDWRPDPTVIRELFRFGLPAGFQGVVMNIGGVLLLRFIGSLEYSAEAQAVYAVAYSELFSLITWTSVGLMGATAAIAGQNLGSGRPERSIRAAQVASCIGLGVACTIGALFLSIPKYLLGIFGMTDGKLKTPIQLAIHEDLVYVADPGNLKIEKYTDEGVYLKTFDQRFGGSHIQPNGIVIDSDGDIYVTDLLKHRIVKISSDDGKTLKTFGHAGNEKNQFLEPTGIAIDAKGYLLVVDSVKNRIVKFETPTSKQIEEALTAQQVEKLKELSYTEESENKDIESVDQATDATEQVTEPEQQFVHDMTKPLLQVPNDLVIESTGSFTQVDIGEAMAMDDNGIRLLINNSPKSFSLGIYQIIWTAVDNSGNSAFAIQEIHVVDTLPPVISQIQDKTLEAAVPIKNIVQLQAPSTTDVSGVVSVISDAPEFFPIGETIVTWTATDVAGNESSIEQKVTIVDTTSPSLQIPDQKTVEATSLQNTLVEIGEAYADDISGISSITNNAPEVFSLGITLVTWNAVDNYGNTAIHDQTITVVDTTTPSIFIPNDIFSEAVDPILNYIDIGQASGFDSTSTVSISNDMPISFPFGSTIVTWTAVDDSGNVSTDTQTVTIVDTTVPEILSPSDIVVEATGNFVTDIELGLAIIDDIIEVNTVTNDAPDSFPLGETTVTWTATDSSGNFATSTQTVSVVDTTAPSITAPSAIQVEATGIEGNLADIGTSTASDSVEIISITNDAPDSFPLGETIVTWTATDSSGNFATATQTVSVVDTTSPTLTIPENIIVDSFTLEKLVVIGEAYAFDSVDTLPILTNDAPEAFPLGSTIVTWSVIDQFGNSASLQQTVSVQACGQSISYYNQIMGTTEDDVLMGTNTADLIFAFGGNDMIMGGAGNDCIIGGEGDDIIFGNEGNDHLIGGEGTDIIKGNSGDDKLTGGFGYDILDGGDDFDISYDSDSDIVIKCEEQL